MFMLVMAVALAFVFLTAEARTKQPSKNSLAKPAGALNIPTDAKYLTINSVKMPIQNDAVFGQNPYTGRAGTEWPQGTGNMYIYGAGIWVGAQIGDTTLKKVVSYGYNPNDGYSEWGPGIIVSPDVANHGVEGPPPTWPVILSTELGSWTAKEDSLWPVKDSLGNPVFASAEDSWCFYNDADIDYHDDQASAGDQLNILVKQTTYSFASKLDKNIIFVVWDLYNQGDNDLDSVYIGITVDPDLGNATDDMIGFDSTRNLCWVYNYTPLFDQDIQGVPGFMGFRFFESPLAPDSTQLGLTALTLFTIDTDPANDEERYNLMAGRTTSGGPREPFMVDTSPQDKRFCQSTGPFYLPIGGTARVVFGVIAGENENLLKVNSDYAQSLYNALFVAPIPPIPPVVEAIPGDRKVTLIWGDTSETSYEPFSETDTDLVAYDFEGYRVYRSRTGVEGDFEVLAEFDLANGITNDTEEDVDPEYGTPITVTVHLGDDSGLQRYFVDTDVLNGETYYYAVVAYDYQPKRPKSLESGKRASMVQVIPGTNPAGYIAAYAPDTATHTSAGDLSDGAVTVEIVDPSLVTGHDYKVTFNSDFTWNLTDVTTDSILLADQENQTGDSDYPFVDGMIVRVIGPELGFKDTELESDSLTWYFNEAYMGGRNALNDLSFRIFRMDFVADPGDTTAAGLYEDDFGNNPWGYFLADTMHISVPFEFWDLGMTLDDTTDDVRLWPLMYDFYGDGRFYTDDYLIILNKNNSGNKYSEDFYSNPDHDTDNGAYWGYDPEDPISRYDWDYRFAFSEADPVWAKGDYALLIPYAINTPNDTFTFSTSNTYISSTQAKHDMDLIKAVPNPYFIRNILDRDPNVSHLMFTHLPKKCTIRIYTLAGNLIQKIEHDSDSGQETWNVLTMNDQIPASGVYIYHVSSEFGEKVGRFAIIR